ncbi:MAG: hypothetical protein ACK5YO_02030, partial [Planctomyces sp.]
MAGRIEQMGGRRAVLRSLAGGISAAAVMCLLDGELRGEVGHGELSVVPGRPGRATQRPTATFV